MTTARPPAPRPAASQSPSLLWLVAAALVSMLSGCAARGFTPPTGAGTPVRDIPGASMARTRACAALETFTAEAALSGRIDGRRVRGRLHLGLTRDGQIRLEAVAPFGQPIFTLAGDQARATLFLPRDRQVLRDTAPAAIVEALAGLALSPTDLLQTATGCLGADQTVSRAERFGSGLLRRSTDGGVEIWSREGASPRVVAIVRGDMMTEYLTYEGEEPASLRIVRRASNGGVDLRLSFSQRERNGTLDASAFKIDVPADARPMSLDELKRAGLFGS